MVDFKVQAALDATVSRLERVSRDITKSTSRLSTGSSVPDASANVANFALSSRLALSVAAQNTVNTNISTGVSLGQTADGVYGEVIELATRAKVLALNATSDNIGDSERALLDKEYQKILEEIDRVARDAEFNGIKIAETGIVPIVSASNFSDSTLPAESFIPTGGSNTAVIQDGVLQLIDEPDPAGIQGVFVNDKEFILEAGLTAEFTIEVGLPAGTSPTNIGG
ncbi:MAG: flagellin, partial [Pseudomonadota bacterium]